MARVSIVIPARNEPYLQKTIDWLLIMAKGDIEIIAVLDGYWPDPPIRDDPRVRLIHFSECRGMRAAINSGARVAQGEWLMKCDAHCSFSDGFDIQLAADCQPDWTMVPVRYRLDVELWVLTGGPYEFQYIRRSDLKGKDWPQYAERVKGQELCDLMTSQGSCWFMRRQRFWDLGGLDEANYGGMGREAQEVCLKSWLSGGRYVLDRKVLYAHWSKPYNTYKPDRRGKLKSVAYAVDFWTNNRWPPQKMRLRDLVKKFAPVPTWEGIDAD